MIKLFAGVFFGGAIGSVCRYSVGLLLARFTHQGFPVATFAVNVIGSFCIGLFYAMALQQPGFSAGWRLFLLTGFCGGFTTFSAFAIENVQLLQQGHYGTFALYSAGSFVMCLLAVVAGLYLAKAIVG